MDKEKLCSKNKLFVENVCNSGNLYTFMVSTFSSETLKDEMSCKKSLSMINDFEDGLTHASLKNESIREEAEKWVRKSKRIINQDLKKFKRVRMQCTCADCAHFYRLIDPTFTRKTKYCPHKGTTVKKSGTQKACENIKYRVKATKNINI